MLHIQIIALFMVVVLHDAWQLSGGHSDHPAGAHPGGWSIWAASLLPMAVLGVAVWLVLASFAREVERRGSWRAAMLADRMLSGSRWLAVLLHAANVLAIGLLDGVRSQFGDMIAIDELLVITPPLAVFAVGWWAYYPIDRLLREATVIRMLVAGRPVYPSPTRGQYVLMNVRHQVLLSLVPIAMIAVWSESVQRLLQWLAARSGSGPLGEVGRRLADPGTQSLAYTALQLAGVAVVFTISPLVLRRVWDTVRLGPGPLRTRLAEICQASGVSIRDLLVWRTHGSMINGAVIGLVGSLRYILLTDALLDQLPSRQVEAVMAHEVGHARHKHMPWLAVSMLMGMSGAAMMLSLLAWGVAEVAHFAGQPAVATLFNGMAAEGIVGIGTVVLGLGWFGFVSRRFEWQADAFAVQQLSRMRPPEPPVALPSPLAGPVVWDLRAGAPIPGDFLPSSPESSPGTVPARITPEAVAAMVGALDAVAELNHMSRQQRSWRHGSIAYRQRRLRAIVGEPLDQLRIDRRVRWLKRGLGLALLVMIGFIAWAQVAAP